MDEMEITMPKGTPEYSVHKIQSTREWIINLSPADPARCYCLGRMSFGYSVPVVGSVRIKVEFTHCDFGCLRDCDSEKGLW